MFYLNSINIKKWALIVFAALCLFIPRTALSAEKISDYDVKIQINTDSSIDISESILYDFGKARRHGIYRGIPIKYKARGGDFKLRIYDISVVDDNGNQYTTKITNEGRNKKIRIGDADRFVTGQKRYIIKYSIMRALNYFDDFDELYWNAIGTEWKVPIERAKAVVILPERVSAESVRVDCYYGRFGSKTVCESEIIDDAAGTAIMYTYAGQLNPGMGMTVVAGFDKGLVKKPSAFENAMYILRDNWILFVPIFTFLFMFKRWRDFGRDPEGTGKIDPDYNILDYLTPIEVGALLEETVSKNALVAEIIYLATQGFLTIEKLEDEGVLFKSTDYLFTRLRDAEELPRPFDKKLLKGLVPGTKNTTSRLSDLENKFSHKYKEVKSSVLKSVTRDGYFSKNPATVKAIYFGIAAVLFVLAIIVREPLGMGVIGVGSLIVSAVIVAVFGRIMPQNTEMGAAAKEQINALKGYLEELKTDTNRLLNELKKDSQQFEKYLPYAMVLGVEDEWSNHFADICREPPSWYHGHYGRHNPFYPSHLTRDMRAFTTSASSSLGSQASSGGSGGGGGGSSGGGGGGGGGGSW